MPLRLSVVQGESKSDDFGSLHDMAKTPHATSAQYTMMIIFTPIGRFKYGRRFIHFRHRDFVFGLQQEQRTGLKQYTLSRATPAAYDRISSLEESDNNQDVLNEFSIMVL
jgi:hypothetical protein